MSERTRFPVLINHIMTLARRFGYGQSKIEHSIPMTEANVGK